MGFEQLAELRDRLRAEKQQVQNDRPKQRKRDSAPQAKPREQDPAMEAIWRLQKHFPLAFPVNPAPKVPLKEGILKDAEQHLELLGLTSEQLKQGIATWCKGSRYWASMTENVPRLDLSGQAVGTVTAAQALHAKQQASRQRGQARRNQSKPKDRPKDPAADTVAQQSVS
ncbi:ProQ activator of osmoprotectant transporter prop [Pseudomonas cavernae]|uniref:ProQ activator of osmoprotectant transporter prop n=1 Tax=Pseudomonas cavernae TaxID=2320867 RepID=A0A385YXH0_9PSED|nr:ProQ/FinO family protein [Pseudomonas cavernae]AYC31619.1 ProQ activator of osmoprotectant transporter prop [Pseudomonas cavernae]